MEWRLLASACLLFCTAAAQSLDNEETDGQSSRKILGSSVVTSVSVVMETGNGKHTYFSDAVGHPLSKPHIASQVASPINLLNPDRYEFYTFNDDGELVKRLMTLQEIQGIIAGGDGEASNYNSESHAQMHHPENDVSGVVENVQNVLKEQMEVHKEPLEDHPIIDTPDVSATWNLILPAFFGGDAVTIRETPEEEYNYVSQSTERMNVSSRNPEDDIILPMVEISSTAKESTTSRTTPGSYSSSFMTENTRPIPIVITTEKLKLDDLASSASMNDITTEFPAQTEQENYAFQDNQIDGSTEMNTEEIISSSSTTEENNKIINFPDITERVNLIHKDEMLSQTIEYPKITELVSMITRPTIKGTEKTTTASVTFPPTTQFTHTEQISQTGATLKPVSIKEKNTETPPSTTSDIINDNFVILTLNNDKNNLEQDLNNETSQEVKNGTQLDATKYDVIMNVEQILQNVTNTVFTDNEKVDVENYNATEEIEELLKSPDFNKSVTIGSSIIDKSTTEKLPSTTIFYTTNKLITTEKQDSLSKEGSTPLLESTFGATQSTQTTQKATQFTTTTLQKIQMLTTTPIPYLKENIKTTTPQIKTSTKITTMVPLSLAPTKQSTTTEKVTSNLPLSSRTEPSTTLRSTETTKLIITTPKILESTVEPFIITRFKEPSTTLSSIEPLIFNRFKEPSTILATMEPSIVNRIKEPSTTVSTTITPLTTSTRKVTTTTTTPTTVKLNITTTKQTTTEKITTPLVVTTTTKKLTTTTEKPTTINLNKISLITTTTTTTTTRKPTSAVTFITKQNTESTPRSTFSSSTKRPILPNTTTAKTAQPLTITTKIPTTVTPSSTTVTPPSTTVTPSSTTVTPPSTIGVANISEPYRKTEEFNQLNKIPTQGDTWKLVDTVKPPELNATMAVTTSKPLLEPYIPPVQVDLSTQGNFGMSGLNEDMLMFNKMYNELALKFWSALSLKDINSERSAVVSPFGTISMLAMIFLGARGGTSGEMNDVLKLDDILTFNPHLVFKEITESVTARKSPSAIVRELYTDSYRGKVHEFYKARVRQFYDGHVEEIDFKKIHNVIRRRTNSLISKQTRGQLPQYLEETTLTLRGPLSALSTNIFQADCSQGSTEGRDGELYFIVLPSIRQRRLVPIPAAVWRTGFIAGYDPELDATAVSLGTMNQAISTVFVMPGQQGHSAPGDVLLRLEARLLNTTYMPEMWTQLLKSMLPRPGLEIQLPRFLQKSVINTTDALKRMGLKEMFNKQKADLRGINGNGHALYMADLMQVNEFSICGESQQMHTEIYPSMTEHLENHNEQMRNFKYADYFDESEYDKYLSIPLPLRPRQARLPEIPRLRFDRPFLYFVRHNPTGLILHMGRFNPRLLT